MVDAVRPGYASSHKWYATHVLLKTGIVWNLLPMPDISGGQLIPHLGFCGWKRLWSGHWCFPQWCTYGCRRGRPEWSWRCVPGKNHGQGLQRLLVMQWPWKQLWQFWNWFDGAQWASAGWPELAWCGSTERVVQQLEQGYSEPTEDEQDLMRTCRQEENYNIIKARAVCCHGYRFCCFSGQQWTNVSKICEYGNRMPDNISETWLSKDIWEFVDQHLDY